MSLPDDRKINKAIRQINQKYKDAPEYQITHPVVTISQNEVIIECYGSHHMSKVYDLGLALGGGWFGPATEYGDLPDGSFVKFTEK